MSTEIIDARDIANHRIRKIRVEWEPQQVECCDTRMTLADSTSSPVWVEGQEGKLFPHRVRCFDCGKWFTAKYTACVEDVLVILT